MQKQGILECMAETENQHTTLAGGAWPQEATRLLSMV